VGCAPQVRFFKARQAVSCVCFSPSGQFIAIGERGKKPALRVFQLSTGREVANLQQHAYGIKAAAFSPDDSLVVSVGYECVCAVVAVPGGVCC